MKIRAMTIDDAGAMSRMLAGLSERDRTLIREDTGDRAAMEDVLRAPGQRIAAVGAHDELIGYATVTRLPGWSSHVGELRIVVREGARGSGVGAELTKQALRESFGAGLTKVVVEVPAASNGAVAMFARLGFTGEALLRDHLRDRNGELHDLIVLAHHAHIGMETFAFTGVADELA